MKFDTEAMEFKVTKKFFLILKAEELYTNGVDLVCEIIFFIELSNFFFVFFRGISVISL